MNRVEEDSVSIPIDLVDEILSRLPAKSVGRFRCVSKLWGSTLRRPYFTELFLTRSPARSRLLFAIEGPGDTLSFFSLHQPQNSLEKVSSFVDFHKKFPRDNTRITCSSRSRKDSCGYASGLICLPDMLFPKEHPTKRVICNPITGQYVILPKLRRHTSSCMFLGFDPIDKQYKVLSMTYQSCYHRILTLATGKHKLWKKIKCLLAHEPMSEGICINGVLYYLAKVRDKITSRVKIGCFDVRSEEFKFIDNKSFGFSGTTYLIKYKGKLGVIRWRHDAVELCMWVVEDVERQEWSNVYTLPSNVAIHVVFRSLSVVGLTTTGEIFFSMDYASKPFCVYYFNPERKTLQTVEIKGDGANYEAFGTGCRVHAFIDHVEDLNFIT